MNIEQGQHQRYEAKSKSNRRDMKIEYIKTRYMNVDQGQHQRYEQNRGNT
jgi:hypothetical protein